VAHRFRSLIYAVMGMFGTIASFIIEPISHAGRFLASAFDFRPTPDQSIELDSIRRYVGDGHVVGSTMRRVTAFIKTALAHDEFSAGRYDPGWRCA